MAELSTRPRDEWLGTGWLWLRRRALRIREFAVRVSSSSESSTAGREGVDEVEDELVAGGIIGSGECLAVGGRRVVVAIVAIMVAMCSAVSAVFLTTLTTPRSRRRRRRRGRRRGEGQAREWVLLTSSSSPSAPPAWLAHAHVHVHYSGNSYLVFY